MNNINIKKSISLSIYGYPQYNLDSDGNLYNSRTGKVKNILLQSVVELSNFPVSRKSIPVRRLMNENFNAPWHVNIPMDYRQLDFLGCSNYVVTVFGEIYSMYTHIYISYKTRYDGYYEAGLQKDDGSMLFKCVHRIVAEAFIPNPDNKEQVNHINPNKLDNWVCNLEWNHPWENLRHARTHGMRKKGVTDTQIHAICKMLQDNCSVITIARTISVPRHIINDIKAGAHHYITKAYTFDRNPLHVKLTWRHNAHHV